MDCRALQQILSMCAPKPIRSEMVTPKLTISWTRSMPGMRGGRAISLDLGRLTTISLVFVWFNLRLLMDAHLEIWSSSERMLSMQEAGTSLQVAIVGIFRETVLTVSTVFRNAYDKIS